MTISKRVLPIGILEKFEKEEKIFNAKGQLEKAFTPGEYYLAKYLDEKLPDEWMIHTKPELRNRWGSFVRPTTPDIVIASKYKGIMIIEVKDWKIEKEKYKKVLTKNHKGREICKIFINNNKKNVNPAIKSILYKERMRDGIKDISREILDEKKKNSLLKCGVYFHNCKTKEARNFLNNPDPFNCMVFGNDFLNKEINIDQFIPLLKISKNIKSSQDWLLKFRNWISPPLHSIEGKNILSDKDLDSDQRKFTISTPNKIQKLSGVAGCGKTRIIAIRAAKLAAEGKKVLITCFNITLKNYLEELVERSSSPNCREMIDIFYFHDFCKAYREDRDISYPEINSLENIKDQLEKLEEIDKEQIIHDKENNHDLSYNYDAIIVDEGQDFKESWYKLLRCFLYKNGEMLISIDDKQNIFNREKIKFAGIGAGKWNVLKKSYRLLNEHIDLANKFSDNFFNVLDIEENPLIDKNTSSQNVLPFDSDPQSKWSNVDNNFEAKDKICKILKNLKNDLKIDISDIAVLVNNHDQGSELKKHIMETFQEKIPISDIFHNDIELRQIAKKLFSVSDKVWDEKTKSYIEGRKLKMCTIHSFKGWERRNVIILVPKNANKYFNKKFYTALTRVREKLIVVNISDRYKMFGKENFNQYL